jgi:hypothetical protein
VLEVDASEGFGQRVGLSWEDMWLIKCLVLHIEREGSTLALGGLHTTSLFMNDCAITFRVGTNSLTRMLLAALREEGEEAAAAIGYHQHQRARRPT